MIVLRKSDRLVATAVLGALFMVWMVLLGFDLLQTFANEVDEIGEGEYTAGSALLYTL